MCLWGLVNAVTNGPAQAIYADSDAGGPALVVLHDPVRALLLASTLGPLVTIVMFVLHGNEWSSPTSATSSSPAWASSCSAPPSCSSSATSTRSPRPTRRRPSRAAAPAAPAAPMSPRTAATAADAAAATALRDDHGAAEVAGAVDHVLLFAVLCARQRDDGEVLPALLQERLRDVARRRAVHLHRRPRADGPHVGDRHQALQRLGRQTMVLLKIVGVALLCSMAYLNTNWLHDGGGEPSSATATRPSRCTRSWWSSPSTCCAPG